MAGPVMDPGLKSLCLWNFFLFLDDGIWNVDHVEKLQCGLIECMRCAVSLSVR